MQHNSLFHSIVDESKLISRDELEKELVCTITSFSVVIIWEIVKGDNGEYFRTIGPATPQYVAVISQEEWNKKLNNMSLIL